jgi:hypothetical protein
MEGLLFKSLIALSAAVAVLASNVVPAYAASPGYCQHFAEEAVRQFHRYQSFPDCFHGEDWRWNASRSRHYNWCLGASINTARAQESRRATLLRQCSFLAYGHY